MQLPSGLHTLTVGCSVARVLPSGLHTLTLGDQFNQSLDSMILPSSLHKLTLGRDFNQSLHKKSLPCGLQMLTFGHFCDQDIRNTILPSSLQNLTLGCCFNQSVDGMSLPPNLQVLTFGILVSIRVWQGVQCQAVFRHLRFALHSSRVLSLLSCLHTGLQTFEHRRRLLAWFPYSEFVLPSDSQCCQALGGTTWLRNMIGGYVVQTT